MKLVIDDTHARKRADVVVAEQFPQYSRAALSKLFNLGLVWLDEQQAKGGDKVKLGQVLRVDISPLEQEPDVIELPILFENDDVLVVNKPSGIISHARGRYWQEASVASFVRSRAARAAFEGQPSERAGIVHRLDRATSGVMITAKNQAAQVYLQRQFSDKKVKKSYVALVVGTPEPPEAHIIAPLMRNPSIPQQFKVGEGGKHAETIYKVEELHGGVSKVSLTPLTGRTHQLRIHMQYIGHPIIGDHLYGSEEGEDRLYLHAHRLTIRVPGGEEHTFTAPLPKSFAERLHRG